MKDTNPSGNKYPLVDRPYKLGYKVALDLLNQRVGFVLYFIVHADLVTNLSDDWLNQDINNFFPTDWPINRPPHSVVMV